jgi:hypothetical protein
MISRRLARSMPTAMSPVMNSLGDAGHRQPRIGRLRHTSVDDRHLDWRRPKRSGRRQAGETSADNEDLGTRCELHDTSRS